MENANGPKKCILIVKTEPSLDRECQGMFTRSFEADILFDDEERINNVIITVVDNSFPSDKLKIIKHGEELKAEVSHSNGNEYFLHTIL